MLGTIIQLVKSRKIKRKLKKKNTSINTVNIGNDVEIGSNCIISKRVILGDNVKIKDFTYLNSSKYWITIESNTKIGKFCSIGPGVFVGAGNHDYSFVTTHPILFDSYYDKVTGLNGSKRKATGLKDKDAETIIGNDVWIGQNTIIKRGIKIEDGAVIAGGSVVVKDVPAYSIVGGNPARVIKYRLSEEKRQILLKNKDKMWWNSTIDEIVTDISNMYDLEKYAENLEKGGKNND